MALLLDVENDTKGQSVLINEESDSFNFAQWIERYKLKDIQQCFVDYNMICLHELNMNNDNFSKLMGDQRIINNAHLLQNIINGMQSLHKLRTKVNKKNNIKKLRQSPTTLTRLIFMTQNEHKVFDVITEYMQNLKNLQQQLNTEWTQKIENKKQENSQQIKLYQTQHSQKLNEIDIKMNNMISKLHTILNKTEGALQVKIEDHKRKIKLNNLRHNEKIENIENILNESISMIDENRKCFEEYIETYNHIIHKYENDDYQNNTKHYKLGLNINKERETEIVELGNVSNKYYQETLKILTTNKHKANIYIDTPLKLDDNFRNIYSLNINYNIYNYICNHITKLIQIQQTASPLIQKYDGKENEFKSHITGSALQMKILPQQKQESKRNGEYSIHRRTLSQPPILLQSESMDQNSVNAMNEEIVPSKSPHSTSSEKYTSDLGYCDFQMDPQHPDYFMSQHEYLQIRMRKVPIREYELRRNKQIKSQKKNKLNKHINVNNDIDNNNNHKKQMLLFWPKKKGKKTEKIKDGKSKNKKKGKKIQQRRKSLHFNGKNKTKKKKKKLRRKSDDYDYGLAPSIDALWTMDAEDVNTRYIRLEISEVEISETR